MQTSNSPASKSAYDAPADRVGIIEGDLGAYTAQIDMLDDLAVELPAQLVVTFLADAEKFDGFALAHHQRQRVVARQPHDRGVERAAKAALARADDKQMGVVTAGAAEQRRRRRPLR